MFIHLHWIILQHWLLYSTRHHGFDTLIEWAICFHLICIWTVTVVIDRQRDTSSLSPSNRIPVINSFYRIRTRTVYKECIVNLRSFLGVVVKSAGNYKQLTKSFDLLISESSTAVQTDVIAPPLRVIIADICRAPLLRASHFALYLMIKYYLVTTCYMLLAFLNFL